MHRVYTFQDLQARTLSELHVLRSSLQRELTASLPYSPQARETLASLDIVNRLIRFRTPSGPRP